MKKKPIPPNTVYGFLTVLHEGTRDKYNHIRYTCRCSCGKIVDVLGSDLRSGDIKSCGHYQVERLRIHGLSHTHEWAIWRQLVDRCTNPLNKDWKNYGGRGIKVCNQWLPPDGFLVFLKDAGARPSSDLSIDRINVNDDYRPGNIRWVDSMTQAHNKRSKEEIEWQRKLI